MHKQDYFHGLASSHRRAWRRFRLLAEEGEEEEEEERIKKPNPTCK